MAKLMRNVVLAVKEETTPGVDIVPTSLANSILAKVSDPQPVVAEFQDRDFARPYMGSSGKVQVSVHSEITVEFELAGSAAAGTVPGYAALLKACATGETVVASTSVTYKPITNSQKTVSIYYWLDGLLHKMVGCMGDATVSLNARSIPMVSIKFTGFYSTTTDATLPTDSVYTAFQAPQAVNKINTTAFTLHGISTPFDSFSISFGNQVVYQNMPVLEQILISGRKSSGNISIPMTSVATKAWHDTVKNGTLAALSMTHGVGAGKIITITAPAVQLINPQYADKDGVVMLNMGLDFQPSAGNDEFSIALT